MPDEAAHGLCSAPLSVERFFRGSVGEIQYELGVGFDIFGGRDVVLFVGRRREVHLVALMPRSVTTACATWRLAPLDEVTLQRQITCVPS